MTTLKGIITDIFPAEVYGNFEKRAFWVQQTEEKYPEHWELELQQGDCPMLDKFKVGDRVECFVQIRGRKWSKNGKDGIRNTLKCTEINRIL